VEEAEGVEETTWNVGWSTKEVLADCWVLLNCCSCAASSSFCCWSTGKRSPSWLSWLEDRSWLEPVEANREPGLLSTDVALPLVELMPGWVGMTWTWTAPEWFPLELMSLPGPPPGLVGMSAMGCNYCGVVSVLYVLNGKMTKEINQGFI